MATQADSADQMRAAAAALVADLRTNDRVPGVQIGETAPAFELPDAVGGTVALADRLADGPVVVVFYRGAWCPYCDVYLRALQEALPDIASRGASLVAISPQGPDASVPMVERLTLGFDVLSDLDQSVSDAWHLRFELSDDLRRIYTDRGMDMGKQNADGSWRLPVPATFVLDGAGVVRARHVEPKHWERMDVADVLSALDALA